MSSSPTPTADKPAVEVIARRLRSEAGLRPFLDLWHLTPGVAWQDELVDALASSSAAAVFVGPSGMAVWHNEEVRVAMDRAARSRDEFRVIPVLLPGADPAVVSGFLAQRTWVDFRAGLDDGPALARLAAGVRGEAIEDDSFGLPESLRRRIAGCGGSSPTRAGCCYGPRCGHVQRVRQTQHRALRGRGRSLRQWQVVAGTSRSPEPEPNPHACDATWRTVVCSPGAEPLRSLAQQLAALADTANPLSIVDELTDRLASRDDGLKTALGAFTAKEPGPTLVFIDQFEELLAQQPGSSPGIRDTAQRFVANLRERRR